MKLFKLLEHLLNIDLDVDIDLDIEVLLRDDEGNLSTLNFVTHKPANDVVILSKTPESEDAP